MNRTHGLTHTQEYRIWRGIKQRCTNPKLHAYKDYGGRGITLCKEWADSFLAFSHHVGSRPSPQHTLDRIDNDCGYAPGNVRWVTRKEQTRNMRTNRFFEFQGRKQILPDWASEIGIEASTLEWRLKNGWTVEATLTSPKRDYIHGKPRYATR